MGFEHYLGTIVVLKQDVPSDQRGEWIRKGIRLKVTELVGEQHFHLDWPDGGRAANQVHFTRLLTA